jgi:hypothetical protein
MDPLAQYPHIAALQQQSANGPGEIKRCCETGAPWLNRLDRALSRLDMTRTPSLRGLVKDLFSDKRERLLAAVTELLAYDWFKEKALLDEGDVGFPAGWQNGDDPPFDGIFKLPARSIPFDVKDGSGDGYTLLESRLRERVEAEARRRGVAPPTIDLALDAPFGRKWLDANFTECVGAFEADLAANGLSPRLVSLKAKSGTVAVGLDQHAGASVAGLEEKSSFVAEQIFAHARAKARKLRLTTAMEFVLVYLRRAGREHSDFDSYTVEAACDFLAARSDLSATFAGLLFVNMDATPTGTTATLWDRHGNLPQQLSVVADKVLDVHPKSPLDERRRRATRLRPTDVDTTGALVAGSCDLRGNGCTANGTTGAVLLQYAGDEPLHACQNCRTQFGWS